METFSALLAICAGNSPVSGHFPAQRPVTRALMFSLICAGINCWVNNGEAGDYRWYCTHYDVIVMIWIVLPGPINAKAWLHWTRNHLGQPDFQSGNLKFTIAFYEHLAWYATIKTTEGNKNLMAGLPIRPQHFTLCCRNWPRFGVRSRGVACHSACSTEMGDPTSAWWRVQPRLLTQNRGQFPFYHDHLGRSNQTHVIF